MPVRCHPYPLNYPDLLELNCTHQREGDGGWRGGVGGGEARTRHLQPRSGEGEGKGLGTYGTRPPSPSISGGGRPCRGPNYRRSPDLKHKYSQGNSLSARRRADGPGFFSGPVRQSSRGDSGCQSLALHAEYLSRSGRKCTCYR